MRTWIWPLSWYFRIHELEGTIAALAQKNQELVSQLAAESIAHSCAMTGYATAMEGMIKQSIADYKRMAEWRQRDVEFGRQDARFWRALKDAEERAVSLNGGDYDD